MSASTLLPLDQGGNDDLTGVVDSVRLAEFGSVVAAVVVGWQWRSTEHTKRQRVPGERRFQLHLPEIVEQHESYHLPLHAVADVGCLDGPLPLIPKIGGIKHLMNSKSSLHLRPLPQQRTPTDPEPPKLAVEPEFLTL